MPMDLIDMLGAAEQASAERLTFYIPSKDKNGVEFDPAPWIEEALRLLSLIGGGATAMPPSDGAWLNPDSDSLVFEKVTLVYTFIDEDKLSQKLPEVRRFLHRLGSETGQGEVVCEMDGFLLKIRKFQP